MRNLTNRSDHQVGLILALAGLMSVITQVLGPVALAEPPVTNPGWTLTGSLNTNRYLHTATLLRNGKVLVVGGGGWLCSGNLPLPGSFCYSTVNSTAEIYDPATGTWSYTGSLSRRAVHSATLLANGQVLVAGGANWGYDMGVVYSYLKSAELYDPATGMWRPTGSFGTILGRNNATLLPNGKVLAVAGNAAELYDPASETWSSTGAPTISGPLTLLANGKVLAVAGNAAELYDPATEKWSSAGNLNVIRSASTATLLRNGKVLVTGSKDSAGTMTAELYDPFTGSWSVTGNPNTGGSAVLLPDGKVLVAGGFDSSFLTSRSAELYDPATGTWSLSSNLVMARQSHTATVLTNGEVLVTGGVDGDFDIGTIFHSSAELFDPPPASSTFFVPVILSSSGAGGSFYTSEMTLANRSARDATVEFTYSAAFGGGSGQATDSLGPGKQRIVPDAIAYLRQLGIPIPESGSRGGTLRVRFSGLASPEEATVIVRTSTAVPEGRAGLAYPGVPLASLLHGPAYLCGLRQDASERSNVALENAGEPKDGDITLRLTIYSGNPAAAGSRILPDIVIPPGGFHQLSSILASTGLSLANGYVRVERISGTAPYYAYAVINDQFNSDGSFVPPVLENSMSGRTRLTLPVVVEANGFTTEVVATNWSPVKKTLLCRYVADALTAPDFEASFAIELNPQGQLILPDFVQYLRNAAVPGISPSGASLSGALFAEVTTGDLNGIALAARTSSPGVSGRYGLFYGAVLNGLASTTSAWIYGLQQNAETRSNLALVNTGEADGSADVFRIEFFDGETGMQLSTVEMTLNAKGWNQIGTPLTQHAPATTQGYLRVTRTAGNNPFIVYAVLNDGGQPGERTGDGAFVASAP